MEWIAIGGSSANPPHLEHRLLLDDFYVGFDLPDFDYLFWIPCGERPDKHFAVCPDCQKKPKDHCSECVNHRIAMTEMTVGDLRTSPSLPDFHIWYDDIFGENEPTIVWLRRLAAKYPRARLTWFTGSDSIVPRQEFGGKNEIQVRWKDGEQLWQDQRWNWLVYRRCGHDLTGCCLPQNVTVRQLPPSEGISSSQIRTLIAKGSYDWERMVAPAVANYIKRNGLYGWKERKRHEWQ